MHGHRTHRAARRGGSRVRDNRRRFEAAVYKEWRWQVWAQQKDDEHSDHHPHTAYDHQHAAGRVETQQVVNRDRRKHIGGLGTRSHLLGLDEAGAAAGTG